MSKWTDKIPSFLWIPLIAAAVAGFVGIGWLLFYGVGFVEGFSSVALLIAGWYGFRVANNSDELETGTLGVAFGICFFALMGMALDQTGNILYNKPIEWFFCPDGSALVRDAVQRGVRGGGVSVSQSFACMKGDESVVVLKGWAPMMVRFAEYVAIGYVLLGLSRVVGMIKRRRANART